MGVDQLVKKYVGIGMKCCRRFASKHPLLAFMIFVLIWIYRSFPRLFSLLVYASPVIASTSVLLGTLLFFGHANAPEIRKERKQQHHHEIHNLKFGRVMGDTEIDWRGVRCEVREKAFVEKEKPYVVNNVNMNDDHHKVDSDKLGRSVDKKIKQEAKSEVGNQKMDSGDEKVVFVNRCALFQPPDLAKSGERTRRNSIGSSHSVRSSRSKGVEKFPHRNEDDKGWETGSELAESTSPTASMAEMFPILDVLHPLIGVPEVPHHAQMLNLSNYPASSRHSLDSGYYEHGHEGIDKEDEEEEEEETHVHDKEDHQKKNPTQPLENLIARQKVLKNMRIMAEKNMENISQDISYNNATPIPIPKMNTYDLPSDSNENILGSAPSVIMPSKTPFDLSNEQVREKSDPVDSVTVQPKSQFSHRHESFDVGPSTLGASKQGKHGHNLGPYFVAEPVTPDAPNFSSMHRNLDELSDHSKASSQDTESVGSSQTEEDQHSRQVDHSTSMKEGFYTQSVSSVHFEYGPSREADSVKNLGNYPELVVSAHYEDDPSREAGLTSVKSRGYSPESVGSAHYEDNHPRESGLNSVKSRGYSPESVGSPPYEDNRSGESGLTSAQYPGYHPESVPSAHYEDDHSGHSGLTSAQCQGYHPKSVHSAHYEDNHSRESGLTSAQYQGFHPELVRSAHYEDNHSRESGLTSQGYHPESVPSAHFEDNHSRESGLTSQGYHPESVRSAHFEDNHSRESGLTSAQYQGYHPESVHSAHYEDHRPQEADLTSVKKQGYYAESVGSSYFDDDRSREGDLSPVKNHGYFPEPVASVHYEDDRSRQADLSPVKNKGYYAESVGSAYTEDDPSPEADSTSVKKGFYEHGLSRETGSTSVKEGNYAESVASAYTEDDPSHDADVNSVKDGHYASEVSEYVSQSGSSDDVDSPKDVGKGEGRPDDVKTIGGVETGYQGKSRSESSSSPFSDVPDHVDDEDDDFRSVIMPLTSSSKEQKIQEQDKGATANINSKSTAEDADSSFHDSGSEKEDAESSKPEHGNRPTVSNRLPQRLSQVQQGFTSWFGWKA